MRARRDRFLALAQRPCRRPAPPAGAVVALAPGSLPERGGRALRAAGEEEAPPGEVPLVELPEAAAVLQEVGTTPPRVKELSWRASQEEAKLAKELLVPHRASFFSKSKRGGPAFYLYATRPPSSREHLDESEKQLFFGELPQVSAEESSCSAPHRHSLLLPPSCSNLLRIQLGRPPNIKEVLYDNSGNVTVVPRLDPACLPKRWVKPFVEVVDPDMESQRQEALKTVSGRCKQRQRSKPPWVGANAIDPNGGSQPRGVHQVMPWSGPARATWKKLPEQVPPPPPPGRALEPTSLIFVNPTLLMKTMQLAPGVTVRGAGSTTWGMQPAASQGESESMQEKLKPISSHIPFLPPVPVEKVTQEPRTLPQGSTCFCSTRAVMETFQG